MYGGYDYMNILDIAAIIVLAIIAGVAAWYWIPVFIRWDLNRRLLMHNERHIQGFDDDEYQPPQPMDWILGKKARNDEDEE